MLQTDIVFCSGFSKVMCLYELACVFLGSKTILTEMKGGGGGGCPFWSGVSSWVTIYP